MARRIGGELRKSFPCIALKGCLGSGQVHAEQVAQRAESIKFNRMQNVEPAVRMRGEAKGTLDRMAGGGGEVGGGDNALNGFHHSSSLKRMREVKVWTA